jgi:hypothetical protein
MVRAAKSPKTVRSFPVSFADSAFVIAIAGAALYFTGSSYQHAYYTRFGVDPAILSSTDGHIAVEGARAIISQLGRGYHWACERWLPLLVIVFPAILVGVWFRKPMFAASARFKPVFAAWAARLKIGLAGAAVLVVAILVLVAFAGRLAGDAQAQGTIAEVREGRVWTYHLEHDVISGLPVGQTAEATWVLTQSGVRQLKTGAILKIDGPKLDLALGTK